VLDETKVGRPPVELVGGEDAVLTALRRLSALEDRGVTAFEVAEALGTDSGRVRAELGSLLRKALVRCEGLVGDPGVACWRPVF
jgi:predicted transcriptional regulator